MNRFDIINRIGDKYRVGNTETGEFSYAQALKTVGKDIKDYQKATTGTQHKCCAGWDRGSGGTDLPEQCPSPEESDLQRESDQR